ncbi:DUF6232 family protein [Actinoplanes sp. N902-109]|uniref:DUF6232 family protein n=1 Tax=Actinoplanes sp. (strain N902-109) TaxID=649831 RepID=UPI0003A876B5|nr:DUF6232 family protein [Actinoplanes sp. N902-109]
MVTSDHFVHRSTAGTAAFPIRDLREVCLGRTRGRSRTAPLLLGGALLCLILAAPLQQFIAVFLGLAGIATVGAVVAFRGRPQLWTLQGVYQGETVTLYESPDGRVFHQVSRALRRAIEDGRPPRSSDDLSAA